MATCLVMTGYGAGAQASVTKNNRDSHDDSVTYSVRSIDSPDEDTISIDPDTTDSESGDSAAAPPRPLPASTDDGPSPGTLSQDYDQIEPIGLLAEGAEGGLGEDVWVGSTRRTIENLLPQVPAVSYFPVLQDLLRRLYLTEAKSSYLNGGRPDPGQDLLTLRMQKLESIGLYSEATKLYSQIADEPYHERLARAGILSMMEGGKGSLGCLETRTVIDRFGSLEFWQTMNAVCDLALAKMASRQIGKSESGLESNDIDLRGSDSRIIERLAHDKSFSYRVDTQADIGRLTSLERAALQASNSFVFDRFRYDPGAAVSPAAFGTILGSRNASESMKFISLVRAVSYGLKPRSDVLEQYNLFKNNNREKPVGWRMLATLYAQASTSEPGQAQTAALKDAIRLGRGFGGAYALTPFADMLAAANADDFPADQIQDAVHVILAAGRTVSEKWLTRLAAQVNNKETLLLLVAAELNSDLSTESKYKNASLKSIFEKLQLHEKAMIAALYEKLDKDNELHNYTGSNAYEKLIGLTANGDYVMPVNDLTGDLVQAYNEKRLGESILLSAIALQGVRSGSVNPGLLLEVVGGMRTVGLTRESRALATQAILGLND